MSATGDGPPDAASEAGATLLEMMVVVAILALSAGLVFPNLRQPYAVLTADVSRAALAADLRRARAEAVRTGRPVAFEVEQDGRGYSAGTRDVRLPDAVRLRAEPRSILFAPDGGSAGGRLVMLRRDGRGREGSGREVFVSRGLGVVRDGAA